MNPHLRTAVIALSSTWFSNATIQASMTFDYQFVNQTDGSINASGQFTTGAAATDQGYFLLTSLSISSFYDQYTAGAITPVNLTQSSFLPGSAYNPVSGAFINHNNNNTYNDYGGGSATRQFDQLTQVTIASPSFAL